MADYDQAYAITAGHVGGYANDPVDRGGETYRGIARVHHPDWSSWFGSKTMTALETPLKNDRSSDALVKLMNIQQGARYVEIMARDASQARFARGWIKRA